MLGVGDGVTGVLVNVGIGVKDGVFVRVGVRVGALVFVGPGVFVKVGMDVGLGDVVEDGRTRSVLVGSTVMVGMPVRVCVGISVGVGVISLSICPCASSSETGVISLCEQNFPVIVQAVLNSSWVSGFGFEGELTD